MDVFSGMEGLIKLASMEQSDIVVTAIVGMVGIEPTIAAIKAGKDIALANKETLVCAGHIIIPLAKEMGVKILPVDSEHSAIFQSLNGENRANIKRILLTASGGPFRGKTKEELEKVTLQDALKHPNWAMGKKITVDSSTLCNKALEVMEAKWLFGVDIDDVTVLVHPQSILHSAVEFEDGAVIGQMGTPDMKLPIQYALFYPDRKPLDAKKLDLFEVGALTFEKPDMDTFVGLKLGIESGRKGGNAPTVFNAANEYAVDLFINEKIEYKDITRLIALALENVEFIDNPSVEEILLTRKQTEQFLQGAITK